jgi:integrase
VLYGLRRSEILALRSDHLDTRAGTLRIDECLVATRTGAAWSNAKNERSRRIIPLDDETLREFARRGAVRGATDLGELRAIADLLGHSPEMLMNTYAHALPQSQSAVVERIGRRNT